MTAGEVKSLEWLFYTGKIPVRIDYDFVSNTFEFTLPDGSGARVKKTEEVCESNESKPETSPAIRNWLSTLPKKQD